MEITASHVEFIRESGSPEFVAFKVLTRLRQQYDSIDIKPIYKLHKQDRLNGDLEYERFNTLEITFHDNSRAFILPEYLTFIDIAEKHLVEFGIRV